MRRLGGLSLMRWVALTVHVSSGVMAASNKWQYRRRQSRHVDVDFHFDACRFSPSPVSKCLSYSG